MRRLSLILTIALGTIVAACEDGSDILVIDESGSVYLVDSNLDEGDGSLRGALEAANADPLVNTIQVESGVGTISLAGSLTYTGNQALRILGNGVVVDGAGCGCDLLVSTGGGDLDLFDLTLRDGERGLYVPIPASRSGTVEIRLVGVTAEDNGLHGVHLDDQASNSGADLHLELISTSIRSNGFRQGVSDYDGVRVDEGGTGSLTFVARDADSRDNAGDGVDLREAGTGDLFIDVRDSNFGGNGEQPQDLESPEDGLDAREAGSGSIDLRFVGSAASGNASRGLLLEEGGAGDVRGTLTGLVASDNGGDNLALREDVDAVGGAVPGAGGISLTFSGVTARESAANGATLEEFGAGDLMVQILDSDLSDNQGDGLRVFQAGTGKGSLHLVRLTTERNGASPVSTGGTLVTEGDDLTTLIRVRNDQDDGFGSLRAALEMADTDEGITEIVFEPGISVIEIESTLAFSGAQDLRITAQGSLIDAGDCDCDAFVISGSGSVVLAGLSIQDASKDGIRVTGGGDLTLRNLILRRMGGNGLLMDVAAGAQGVVTVILDGVLVEDNGLHGVFIDDLAPGSGSGTGATSPAGIKLEVLGSTVQRNGFRQDVTDRDGIRVDEGGLGDIDLRITNSGVLNNAGDGVELNEEGLGLVATDIQGSQLDGNGRQPQNTDDQEGGLDISELGPGALRVRMLQSFIRDNFSRGLGLVEEGSGDVSVVLEGVTVTGNDEENLAITEDNDARSAPQGGGGGLFLSFTQVTSAGAGTDGVLLEEFGVGDLTGQIVDSSIRNNARNGVDATQTGAGAGQIQLVRVVLSANGGQGLVTDGVGVAIVPVG